LEKLKQYVASILTSPNPIHLVFDCSVDNPHHMKNKKSKKLLNAFPEMAVKKTVKGKISSVVSIVNVISVSSQLASCIKTTFFIISTPNPSQKQKKAKKNNMPQNKTKFETFFCFAEERMVSTFLVFLQGK
jgi:hypothetical protein